MFSKVCVNQCKICGNRFSSLIMWDLGTELRLPGLLTSVLSYRVILPAHQMILLIPLYTSKHYLEKS